MPKKPTKPASIDEYFGQLDADRRTDLEQLRAEITKALPKAKEELAYGMPAYSLHDELLVSMASQKQYLALYICRPDLLEEHRAALSHLDCGKGCIRFKRFEELPLPAIRKLLKQLGKRG